MTSFCARYSEQLRIVDRLNPAKLNAATAAGVPLKDVTSISFDKEATTTTTAQPLPPAGPALPASTLEVDPPAETKAAPGKAASLTMVLDRGLIEEEIKRVRTEVSSAAKASGTAVPAPPAAAPSSALETTSPGLAGKPKPSPLLPPPQQFSPGFAVMYAQLKMLKAEAGGLQKVFTSILDWLALKLPSSEDEDADESVTELITMLIGNLGSMVESLQSVYGLERSYLDTRISVESNAKRSGAMQSSSATKALEALDKNLWQDIEKGWRLMLRCCLLSHALLVKNLKNLRGSMKTAAHLWM